jgi:uncharacterized protein (TIGR02466 family)
MIKNEEIITYSLFPTAVLKNNIGRKFTKEELNFVEKNKNDVRQNEGNTTSAERYIFENKILKNLHNECLEMVNFYLKNVIIPKYKVSPYITQAWLNYTEPGQFHHRHAHANSYLSGVLYIHAEKEDKIHFYKDVNYQNIKLTSEEFNIYNSDSWWIPVKTGDIVVFPSNFTHMVTNTESKNTRISLAFNTFLKGTIGDPDTLTELKIE